MTTLPAPIVAECKAKLLVTKGDLLSQLREQRAELAVQRFSGDEADMSAQVLDEERLLISAQRIRNLLLEVEFALARIEQGRFGICEETAQVIETSRLLAIPWTRLSIEGAEIRETERRRHSS